METSSMYTKYYLEQAGYGSANVFRGTRIQRGYGIGGFFASLFRSVAPMLKHGAKTVGKTLLRTGLDVASDALAGRNIKEAAREHFQQTGKDLANRAVAHLRSQVGSGPLTLKNRHLIPLPKPAKLKRKKTTACNGKRKISCKKKKKSRVIDILS